MSRKDYRQGMADAMEAYEKFGEKQENAIRYVGIQAEQAAQTAGKLSEAISDITSYITDQEKAELYKLNTPVDIADLDDSEKRILLAVLYQLISDEDDPTEAQQHYIRSVQQYLKIYNPQTEIDLEAVENIEDVAAQKAVLQSVLEFFYLGSHPETYTEKQLDFLDCFQVNRKSRKEIISHIDAIIGAVGAQGLSEKYGFAPQQPKSEFALYNDNGEIPSKVADSCIELLENGGVKSFKDGSYFLELQDYLVFCKDINYDDEDCEDDCLRLFRVDKQTGKIDLLPLDYAMDLPIKFSFHLSYHLQGNMLYLIEDDVTHWEDQDNISYVQPVAINVAELTYYLIPVKFKGLHPGGISWHFPRFHLSGDTTHLVIFAYELNSEDAFHQTYVVDLTQNRAFLIEPDMEVRDAFWWDNSLMFFGKYDGKYSIFRYDISTKALTDLFVGTYVKSIHWISSGLIKAFSTSSCPTGLIKRIDYINNKFYFLICETTGCPCFSYYSLNLFEYKDEDGGEVSFTRFMDCCCSPKSAVYIDTPFFFREDCVIHYDYSKKGGKLLKYDYHSEKETVIDNSGTYILLGDYLYKKDSDIWYKANISAGTDNLQWEYFITSEY